MKYDWLTCERCKEGKQCPACKRAADALRKQEKNVDAQKRRKRKVKK